jgi:hypothetical protein
MNPLEYFTEFDAAAKQYVRRLNRFASSPLPTIAVAKQLIEISDAIIKNAHLDPLKDSFNEGIHAHDIRKRTAFELRAPALTMHRKVVSTIAAYYPHFGFLSEMSSSIESMTAEKLHEEVTALRKDPRLQLILENLLNAIHGIPSRTNFRQIIAVLKTYDRNNILLQQHS